MNRLTPTDMQRSIDKARRHTVRSVRRAWNRHVDRLASDPTYRDDLIDVAIIIASTVIRHPAMRILDARLLLRRAPVQSEPRRRLTPEPERTWGSPSRYDNE